MPKQPQGFRKSPIISITSSDPAEIMDAIADWLNDSGSTYYNGASRVPDEGVAWTAIKEDSGGTVAIRLQPPATSTRRHHRVMIMGQASGSPTPSMAGSDAYSNNTLYVAHVKFVNHGDETDYQGFEAAQPYDGHEWTTWMGYKNSGTTITGIEILEGIEGISIWMRNNSSAASPQHAFYGGDIFDKFGGGTAESDGGLYGITSSGYGGTVSTNSLWSANTATTGQLFTSVATAGRAKTYGYTPGGSALQITNKIPTHSGVFSSHAAPTATNLRASNVWDRLPFGSEVGGTFQGFYRGLFVVADTPSIVLEDGSGNPVAYLMGSGATQPFDTVGFSAFD